VCTVEFGVAEVSRPKVQVGEDALDVLSCRSFSAKETPITGLFCRKRPIKIRHSMGLR